MNPLFLITAWSNIKDFFKTVKNFCVKYWKLLVAGALVVIGYVLGRRNDTTAVDRVDAEALSDAAKKQRDDTVKLVKDHLDNRESLLDDYEKRLNDIDGERKKIIEDLSNNDEKLDKILKEKYDLKKGD